MQADQHVVLPSLTECLIFHPMSVKESILHDLQGMSNRALVDDARYVHKLNASAQKERAEVLRATHGCLNEAEGQAFEEAMGGSRPKVGTITSAPVCYTADCFTPLSDKELKGWDPKP
jgi:hypothetical protein